jgi:membrane fusion protein, multidrug efflux system
MRPHAMNQTGMNKTGMNQKWMKAGAAALAVVGTIAAGAVMFGAGTVPAIAQGAPQGPVPVEVSVMAPEQIMIWNEFSGRLIPVDYAIIKPQVSGTITEIRFQDGQHVEKGDILMVIDPRSFDATLKETKAKLASAQNAYALSKAELDRAKDLMSSSALSRRTYDERLSTARSDLAAIDAAKAQVQQAEVNLDYAYMKAPISGRVGRAELTVGNVVQAGSSAPTLTSVVSDQGIYADFEVDEQTYLKSIRSGGATDKEQEEKIPVQILLGGNEDQLVEGKIHTFDNHIDPASGTIRARAVFDNAEGRLLPGMFVKVRLGNPSDEEKIMVSEKSVGTDQSRKFVYVVDDKDTVQYRPVDLGGSSAGRRVVISGLESGEKVIADGIIKIRPGMPVKPLSHEEMEAMNKAAQDQQAAAPGGSH